MKYFKTTEVLIASILMLSSLLFTGFLYISEEIILSKFSLIPLEVVGKIVKFLGLIDK